MTSDELYEAFREDVGDVATPYLWSDDEIWRYAADAQRMFVRLTGGIADFMSDACEVPIVTGEAFAELHPSILRIMSATKRSSSQPVQIINHTSIGNTMSPVDYGSVKSLMLNQEQGEVRYGVLGLRRDTIRWVQIPAADDVVDLHVYRMPLEILSGPGQLIQDIEDEHHIHLLWWMKHLAYSKNDTETFNKTASREAKEEFETYCRYVWSEWERYKHKTRVVSYGGL
jgi:hypothetical protein